MSLVGTVTVTTRSSPQPETSAQPARIAPSPATGTKRFNCLITPPEERPRAPEWGAAYLSATRLHRVKWAPTLEEEQAADHRSVGEHRPRDPEEPLDVAGVQSVGADELREGTNEIVGAGARFVGEPEELTDADAERLGDAAEGLDVRRPLPSLDH